MEEAKVQMKGQSDSYDRVLEKITDLNNRLASEVSKVKEQLESLNPVYEQLAINAGRYADSVRDVRNTHSGNWLNVGGSIGIDSGSGRGSKSGKSGSSLGVLGGFFGSTHRYDEVVNSRTNLSFPSIGGGKGGKSPFSLGGLGGLGNIGSFSGLFNSLFQPLFPFDEVIAVQPKLPLWFPPLTDFLDDKFKDVNKRLSDILSILTSFSFASSTALSPVPTPLPIPSPVPVPSTLPGLAPAPATVPVPAPAPFPLPAPVPIPLPSFNPEILFKIGVLEPAVSPAWSFIKDYVLNKVKSFNFDFNIKSVLSGEGLKTLAPLLESGVLFSSPLSQAITLTWLGFETLEKFRVSNSVWHTVLQFSGVETLKNMFSTAVNFLESRLTIIKMAVDGIGQSFSSIFSGLSLKGFLDDLMRVVDILSWVLMVIPGLGWGAAALKGASIGSKVLRGGKAVVQGAKSAFSSAKNFVTSAIPAYANGGFHVKPHLGIVGDAPEVTLPLHSSAAEPAYRGIAENILSKLNGSGGVVNNFDINLGQNSTIIADTYSLRTFSEKIADLVEQRLRSTGALSYGVR